MIIAVIAETDEPVLIVGFHWLADGLHGIVVRKDGKIDLYPITSLRVIATTMTVGL